MANRSVVVNFFANTAAYVAGVSKATGATTALGGAATMALARIAGPAALVYGMSQASKASLQFQDEMTKLKTQIGLTNPEIDQMRRAALSLGGETTKAPQELAEATFFIASAGLRGAQAMEVLKSSAKLSAIGLGETKTIADLLTSAVNAYGGEALSAASASDSLVSAVRLGKLEADSLAGAMGSILPVAAVLGVSFNEVSGLMAAMSRTGTDAATASTQLTQIMMGLLRPSNQASEALHALGLTSEGLRATIADEGLFAALQQMLEAADGNVDAFGELLPNVRAFRGAADLMGPGLQANIEIMREHANATGLSSEAFEAFSVTTRSELDRTSAELQRTMILIGDRTEGIVFNMTRLLRSSIQAVGDAAARAEDSASFTQGVANTLTGALRAIRDETQGLSRDEREAAMATGQMTQQMSSAFEAYNRLTLAQQADAFSKDVRLGILRGQIGVEEEVTNKFLQQAIALELAANKQSGLNADVARWNGLAALYGESTDAATLAQNLLAAGISLTTEEMEAATKAIDEQRRANLALINPVYGAVRAQRDYRDALDELTDASLRLSGIPEDQARETGNLAAAQRDAAAASSALSEAEATLSRLKAEGKTRTDAYREAQERARDAQNALRDAQGRAQSSQARINDLTQEAADLNDRLVDAVFDVMMAEVERQAALKEAGLVTEEFNAALQRTAEELGIEEDVLARVIGRLQELGINLDLLDGRVISPRVDVQLSLPALPSGLEWGSGGLPAIPSGTTVVTEPRPGSAAARPAAAPVRNAFAGIPDHLIPLQFRARGGPVMPGGMYVVGEQGPELFSPAVAGSIIPNGPTQQALSGAGGGITIQSYNTYRSADDQALLSMLEMAQQAGRL